MTSKLTREWLKHQISAIEAVGITDSNTLAAFKLALAAMDSEPAMFCSEETLAAARDGEHLLRTLSSPSGECVIPLYRHAQQPVVPDESYQQLSDLYHAQEKRLFKIAQRIKGPAFDKYSHSASQAIDVLEVAIFGEDDACRAAMLQELQKSAGVSNNCRSNEKLQDQHVESLTTIKATPAQDSLPKNAESRSGNYLANDTNVVKRLTITLPDSSSKAFWSGTGKTETFHPVTYRRWVKEAIERCCAIARIDVEVK